MRFLAGLADASVDGLVTDPPYSSGGFTRGDRTANVHSKYVQGGDSFGDGAGRVFAPFMGDNRDGRSWSWWCALWLSECARVVRPGGVAMMFCDWRQLPTATDAFQAGGLVWRGIICWDKGEGARAPHTGYARHQAEYVVWGSNGSIDEAPSRGPFPGVIRETVKVADKHHMTGKPTEIMRALVRMAAPVGGLVIDPFAGSGTTGVACVMESRRFLGAELTAEYSSLANERIVATEKGLTLAQARERQKPLFESARVAPATIPTTTPAP